MQSVLPIAPKLAALQHKLQDNVRSKPQKLLHVQKPKPNAPLKKL
jgi:hypothetical protein